MYDLVIKGGRIIDGTGNPWYRGDVAIEGEKIARVGRVYESSESTIDASGLVVSPGFIDVHSHSDLMLLTEPEAKAKIMQGVTTEIVGQDGLGEAPIREDVIEMWRKYLSGLNGNPDIEWTWRSFGDYLKKLEEVKPAVNVASLVGHGNLRLLAVGMDNRKPTPQELDEMKRLLAESMEQGALGMSTGLIYPPCVYSDTYELTELCKTVNSHNGVFVVHMRNEGDKLLESIEEVVSVGRGSGVPVHISHFKSNGRANWGKSMKALEKLDFARKEGVDITFDQYPYTAGSTFLGSLLPPWVHEGGVNKLIERLRDEATRKKLIAYLNNEGDEGSLHEWDRILVTFVATCRNKKFEGKYISQIGQELNKTPAETVLDLVIEEENAVTMASFTMSEDDVKAIMKSPLGMVCSDGILLGKPHPRAYGSFARVPGRYVSNGTLNLEDAIRKMTSYPAQKFSLIKRGLIKYGFYADITIFDPRILEDKATFEEPIQHPTGINYVIVNGNKVLENNKYNNKLSGMVLKNS